MAAKTVNWQPIFGFIRHSNRYHFTFEQDLADDPAIKRYVQAYYGLFLEHLDNANRLPEYECFASALLIDKIVPTAVTEFSINPHEIENQIRHKLLPVLSVISHGQVKGIL